MNIMPSYLHANVCAFKENDAHWCMVHVVEFYFQIINNKKPFSVEKH